MEEVPFLGSIVEEMSFLGHTVEEVPFLGLIVHEAPFLVLTLSHNAILSVGHSNFASNQFHLDSSSTY